MLGGRPSVLVIIRDDDDDDGDDDDYATVVLYSSYYTTLTVWGGGVHLIHNVKRPFRHVKTPQAREAPTKTEPLPEIATPKTPNSKYPPLCTYLSIYLSIYLYIYM